MRLKKMPKITKNLQTKAKKQKDVKQAQKQKLPRPKEKAIKLSK
jgi:hypothetical protein